MQKILMSSIWRAVCTTWFAAISPLFGKNCTIHTAQKGFKIVGPSRVLVLRHRCCDRMCFATHHSLLWSHQ